MEEKQEGFYYFLWKICSTKCGRSVYSYYNNTLSKMVCLTHKRSTQFI